MSFSLFISDLHLWSNRPAVTQAFIRFTVDQASKADKLFILGDLFEYWAGDDDSADPHHASVIQALSELSQAGIPTFFIHGNRDFLIGDRFAEQAAITLLPDPSSISLYGHQILLSHGDELCTDDTDYQAFRQQVRNPTWQTSFLSQPLDVRKAHIEALRLRSETEKSSKNADIMDVHPEAVAALIRQYGYPPLLIHGHTHRPARHVLEVDGHICERWVLGDWYDQGSCLRLDANGCSVLPVNIP